MPENAIREVNVDYVLSAGEIPRLLAEIVKEDVSYDPRREKSDTEDNKRLEMEIKIAAEEDALQLRVSDWGDLSPFSCPECSGVLSRINDGGRPRYRCHTGHAYSADALLSALTENLEESFWKVLRGLDETVMLLEHIGDHFAEINESRLAAKFFRKANEARERNVLIRRAMLEHENLTIENIEREPETANSTNGGVDRQEQAESGTS
jgi:two-component system chemotaxis response regulator CheB